MNEKQKVNELFSKVKNKNSKRGKKLADATYSTILAVAITFFRWLNDGEKPKACADIKNTKRFLRKLEPSDMITLDDAKKMMASTPDVQIHAVLMALLEGGFRPSEFIDLKIGDVTFDGKYASVRVRGSKTESATRSVVLVDATPYLAKWLNQHPLRADKKAPLWITMRSLDVDKPQVYPYKAPSIQKRIREIGKKAGIKKPLYFYNFRHSAVVLAKKLGLQDSMAMKNFGHKSTMMYSCVYGRLFDEDVKEAIAKAHGDPTYTNGNGKRELPKECERCHTINEVGASLCSSCGTALSVAGAIAQQEKQKNMTEELIKAYLEKVGLATEELTTKKNLMKNERHK